MKNSSRIPMPPYQKTFAALLAAFSCTSGLFAANLTWDASGVATTSPTDGAGTWDTTGANWNNGSVSAAWPNTNANIAVFGANNGAAGTIAVSTVTTNGLTFNAPGSGNYTLSGGTITFSGTTPTITANVDATIGSVIAGTVGLTKSGAGVLTLSGTNTYSGGTTLGQGTISYTAPANIGAGTLTLNGGTLRYTGSATNSTLSRALVLTTAGGTLESSGTGYASFNGALTYSGSGNRTLTIGGNSASTLATSISSIIADGAGGTTSLVKNGTSYWQVSGANTYSGDTTINAGMLYNGSNAGISPNSTVYLNTGATIQLGSNQTIKNLQDGTGGGGTITQSFTTGTLTATIQSGSFSGTIKDTNSTRKTGLTKTTGGTLTLSGTLSFTGATNVNGGSLKLGSASAVNLTGTSGVIIAGGTLTNAAGDSRLGTGAVSMSSGAITPGGVGTIGSFTLAASQAFTTTGGTLNFDLSSSSSFDQILGSGTGTFNLTDTTIALSGLTSVAGTYQLFSGFGGANSITNLNITGVGGGFNASLDNTGLLTVAASGIPEPSTCAALTGVVMLGFAALRRRRG
jgi:autotransporter-associated beta strand protein